MPQQRRKVAFSGKKKKDQILQKRSIKGPHKYLKGARDSQDEGETTEDTELTARKLMEQPAVRAGGGGRNKNANRYNLQFYQDSKKELEQMKLEAYTAFHGVEPKQREIDAAYFANYDFPVRPPWNSSMDKETLDRRENRYLREYVDQLQKLHSDVKKDHSLFELNLETWRQLWRVLEMSDILLIIVDVRYAALMFPPALYRYIVEVVKKHAILVLNKVDLVDPEVVVAWQHYFKDTYPSLPVVLFASYTAKITKGTSRARMDHNRSMEGVSNIFRACQQFVQSEVNLSSWEQKILEDSDAETIDFAEKLKKSIDEAPTVADEAFHPGDEPHVMFREGVLTLGCIGFPNVGKSSLLNALKGRKVVSVSRTPGHTKHFQTIFLTKDVRLCDCPGLVFPSATPKYLQVLLGSYPISQLQVPYRSLKFLGEHLNLPQLLKIQLPEDYDEWSAAAVADAWALKRGFLTAKAARPDRYRAANNLLRMCLAGHQQLILQFYPPDFFVNKDEWLRHPAVEHVRKYQNVQSDEKDHTDETSPLNSDSCDSDGTSSSNDETNADEEDDCEDSDTTPAKSQNAFALLGDN